MTAAPDALTVAKPLFRIAVPSFRMARPEHDVSSRKVKRLTRKELERAFRAELGREKDPMQDRCPELSALRAALYPKAARGY